MDWNIKTVLLEKFSTDFAKGFRTASLLKPEKTCVNFSIYASVVLCYNSIIANIPAMFEQPQVLFQHT